jgi:hypothetical protein
MSNGRPWTEEDGATLERMQGRPLAEIAQVLGRPIPTVKARNALLGFKTFRGRARWTRHDWLMADAAGLDFQISI